MESESKSVTSTGTTPQLLQRLLPLYPRAYRRAEADELLEESHPSSYIPPSIQSPLLVNAATHASNARSHSTIQVVIHELHIDNTPVQDVHPSFVLDPAGSVNVHPTVPIQTWMSSNHHRATKSHVLTNTLADHLRTHANLTSLNSLLEKLVLSYLDYRSLLKLRSTNDHWRRIAGLDSVWLPLCQQLPIAPLLPIDPIKSHYQQSYRIYRLLVHREHERVRESYRSEVELAKEVRCDSVYNFITAVLTSALLLGGFTTFFILLLHRLQTHSSVHTWLIWIFPLACAILLFVCSGFFVCSFQMGDCLRKCQKRCCSFPLCPTRRFFDSSNAPFMVVMDNLGGYQGYYRMAGMDDFIAHRARAGTRIAQYAFLFVTFLVTVAIVLLCVHLATLQSAVDDSGDSVTSFSAITSSKHAFAFLCIPLYFAILCFILCQPSVRWIDIRPAEHFRRCFKFVLPYVLALIFVTMRVEGVKVPIWGPSRHVLIPVSLIFLPTWLVDLYVLSAWVIPSLRRKEAEPGLVCLVGLLPVTVFKILLTLRIDASMMHLTPIAIASPLFLPMVLVSLLTFYYPLERQLSAPYRWIQPEWPTPPLPLDQFTPPEFIARFRVQYLMQRALHANAPLQLPLPAP